MKRARGLLPLVAGGVVAVMLPALASGQGPGSSVTYRGAPTRAAAASVVSFARLAKIEAQRPKASGPLTPFLLPEPQEKGEPNSHITLPSPFPVLPSTDEYTAGVPSPSPTASFLAHADSPRVGTAISVVPPDTDGAVGLSKVMVTLNNNYVIEDKATGAVLSSVSMPTFWASSGSVSPFDPKTRYDPYNDRWIVSAVSEAGLSTSSILIGVSDTSDPSGTWHLYRVDVDAGDTLWADYPTLGFNKNFVAVHVNMFTNSGNAFSQGRLLVVNYPSLRANTFTGTLILNLPSFTMQPAVTYSSTEETLYGVEHYSSAGAAYRFWTITNPAAPAVTLVGGGTMTNPLGAWSLPGGNVMPQSGGNPTDSGDARALNAVYRNGGIYYAQTIGLPAGGASTHTAVQWMELNTSGNFVQGGRIDDPTATNANGGHWYAFPTIGVNSGNDVLVGFSEFQSTDFIDAAYAVHLASDAAGTMRDPVTLKEGEGNYWKTFGGGRNRWGDYSNVQVDPSNDSDLWTIQEYAGTPVGTGDGSGRWGTWWSKVLGVSAPPPPPPPSFALGVTKSGRGTGTVTSSPAGITCGATCSASFNSGTTVALSQAHAANAIFAGWGGACSGTGACTVTMSAAKSVTATFNVKLTPPACVVPRVIGKKLRTASAMLKTRHCRVGKLTYVKSTTKKKGRVLKETPRAGRRLGNNAKVNLTLGRGPKRR
jgi:hypothetical protein